MIIEALVKVVIMLRIIALPQY